MTSSDVRRVIQGEWIVIMVEVAGHPQPVPSRATVVFKGDSFTATALGESPQTIRFALDPSRKAIDLYGTSTNIDGQPKDFVCAGIYRLEGTRLTLCSAQQTAPRPKLIESTDKNRCDLVVLERP